MTNYPSNADAEKGILSACLQWPNCCDEIALAGGSDLFYSPANRAIWRAMEDMRRDRSEIGFPTLVAKLRESGSLDGCGGPGYVSELLDDVASKAILADLLRFAKDAMKRRALISLCESGIRDAMASGADPDEATQRVDTGIRQLFASSSTDGLKPWSRVMSDFLDDLSARFEQQSGSGISTGFPILDEMTAGLQPGQLWVIGARPSVGKTAFAFQIAEQLARSGNPIAFFSAEMLAVELATRSIAADARLDSLKIQRGFLTKGDFPRISASISRRMHDRIYVDDRAGMRLVDIQVGCRRAVSEYGVKVAFVDYLQLIREESGSRNREDAVRRLSNGLKEVAKETGITVVALAQLNRQTEGKDAKPRCSNLRDSGSIEQDANTVVLLHREHPGRILAIVDKARGGRLGEIAFDFDGPTTRFHESRDQPEEED